MRISQLAPGDMVLFHVEPHDASRDIGIIVAKVEDECDAERHRYMILWCLDRMDWFSAYNDALLETVHLRLLSRDEH